jgi:GMP synthase (glutamine-hydrolysing)
LKRILVIDNHIDPPHGVPEIARSLGEVVPKGMDVLIDTKRGPEQKYSLDTQGLSGVVISGSKTRVLDNAPWIDALMGFVRKLHAEKIPTLGICYGEQIMAKAFGGDSFVRTAPTCEFGFVAIEQSEVVSSKSIFQGLPQMFHSFCYHYDEVVKLPPGFQLTAGSKDCAIHALEAEDAPMWGVQFHPEKNLAECRESMGHIQKIDPSVKLFNAEQAAGLYDAKVAKAIFSNFLIHTRSK